jgi:hypothetical protein
MEKLSKRQITIVEKYLSTSNPTPEMLQKEIQKKQIEILRKKEDIQNIQRAHESKIGALTDFKISKCKFAKQQIVQMDYRREEIQIETMLFCDAIQEEIDHLESEIKSLLAIKSVDETNRRLNSPRNPKSPRISSERK